MFARREVVVVLPAALTPSWHDAQLPVMPAVVERRRASTPCCRGRRSIPGSWRRALAGLPGACTLLWQLAQSPRASCVVEPAPPESRRTWCGTRRSSSVLSMWLGGLGGRADARARRMAGRAHRAACPANTASTWQHSHACSRCAPVSSKPVVRWSKLRPRDLRLRAQPGDAAAAARAARGGCRSQYSWLPLLQARGLEGGRDVAALALLPVLAQVHVVARHGMTAQSVASFATCGGCLWQPAQATFACAPVKRELGRLAVIEFPEVPAVRRMAGFAVAAERALVRGRRAAWQSTQACGAPLNGGERWQAKQGTATCRPTSGKFVKSWSNCRCPRHVSTPWHCSQSWPSLPRMDILGHDGSRRTPCRASACATTARVAGVAVELRVRAAQLELAVARVIERDRLPCVRAVAPVAGARRSASRAVRRCDGSRRSRAAAGPSGSRSCGRPCSRGVACAPASANPVARRWSYLVPAQPVVWWQSAQAAPRRRRGRRRARGSERTGAGVPAYRLPRWQAVAAPLSTCLPVKRELRLRMIEAHRAPSPVLSWQLAHSRPSLPACGSSLRWQSTQPEAASRYLRPAAWQLAHADRRVRALQREIGRRVRE